MGSYLRLALWERWNHKHRMAHQRYTCRKILGLSTRLVKEIYLVEEAEHGHPLWVSEGCGQVSVVVLHMNNV